MRKIFTILAALIAAVCVSSCNLDREQNYIFSYDYTNINLKDKDDADAVKKYFDENFGNNNTDSYFGTYYDAYQKAVAFFNEGVKELDMEYLYSFIKEDSDQFILYYIISGDKVREYIGGYPWNKETQKIWEKEQSGKEEDAD